MGRMLAQTYRLPDYILVDFVVTLTLNFQVQIRNLLYLSQKWSDFFSIQILYCINNLQSQEDGAIMTE